MIKNKFQPKNPIKPSSSIPIDALVDYEQHGKVIFGLIKGEAHQKFQVENESGDFINLPKERLHFYPMPLSSSGLNNLKNFASAVRDLASKVQIEELWRKSLSDKSVHQFQEILKSVYENPNLMEYTSIRIALLMDKIYFKREKNGFSRKSEEEISASKAVVADNLKAEAERLALNLAIKKILRGDKKTNLPPSITEIEIIAAQGKKAENAKAYSSFIDSICEEAKLCDHRAHIDEKAYAILTRIEYISPNHNLIPLRLGRPTTFSKEERENAEQIFQEFKQKGFSDREEFSEWNIYTIDSDTTQDFDDAISYKTTSEGYLLGIHITDVSSSINIDSSLDRAALRRGTSIYCPDETFPMFPPSLSEGVLSLKEGALRPCLSFVIEFDSSGQLLKRSVKRSLITVSKRLSYDQVDESLSKSSNPSDAEDILNLWKAAQNLEARRLKAGATAFARRDLSPEISKNGKVKLVSNTDDTPARKLVSEMMILANETASNFASQSKIPFLYRAQPFPDVNIEEAVASVPEGPAKEYARRSQLKRSEIQQTANHHFSLGLDSYCQITSPIRRYLDLVLIRQLSNFLADGTITYSHQELEKVREILSPNLDEANVIQRERNRFWLLKYIEQLKTKSFQGTVVRLDGPRPLVEIKDIFQIFSFLPDKKANNLQQRLKLGDEITVEITKLLPHKDKLYLQEVSKS